MNELLKDPSPQALVTATKANLFEWYRYLGRSPNAEFCDTPQLTWLRTGISNSFVNTVVRARLEPDQVDATIEETLAHFRDLPALSWWTEPDTRPSDLGAHLLAHGLTYTDGGTGMAADLLAMDDDLPAPPNLTIERVEDTEGLQKWAYASIIGFEHPETDVRIWFEVFSGLGFDLPLRSYVAILNGEPVAASQLFLAAGVVGIYVVATVPGARRRGIGAEVTLASLRDARAMGYRFAILHASPMGEGVYRRLGFQECCRMNHYEWAGDAGQR
jgi:ribosomal protein S18 acetylase RimI-like enzyme